MAGNLAGWCGGEWMLGLAMEGPTLDNLPQASLDDLQDLAMKSSPSDSETSSKPRVPMSDNCFSPMLSTSSAAVGHAADGTSDPKIRPNVTKDSPGVSASQLSFYSEDAIREVCKSANRCRPRGPFSGVFSNFFACWFPGESISAKAWAKNRAITLLELNKRQQMALTDKQDAIEVLEWRLEQLQMTDCKKPATRAGNPHSKTSTPGDLLQNETSSETSGSSSSSNGLLESTDDSQPTCTRPEAAKPKIATQEIFSEGSGDAEETSDGPCPGTQETRMSARILLFEMALIRARVAVRYFCKVFMNQMEISGYSVWRTLAAIDPDASFGKKEHSAFALESNINKAMYHCFENDSFDETGLTLIIDPSRRCTKRFEEFQRMKLVDAIDAANSHHVSFEPKFLAFCERKMRGMWFLFPWNIVFKEAAERQVFTGAFLDAAKCVWLLHRLAFSFNPVATILRVGRGMELNPLYVETVTPDATIQCQKCTMPKVQFMTMPGFQVHQKVIKCQVYQHLQC